jgi:transcriptional regulator with XRE-family HTH domain
MPMDWKVILGRNILRLRSDRKWSQQDLACHAELSVRFLSGVERGEENPSMDTLISIANALDIPPWKLLYEDARAL